MNRWAAAKIKVKQKMGQNIIMILAAVGKLKRPPNCAPLLFEILGRNPL